MPELSKNRLYRLYEILPGVMVWATFLLLIVLSFLKPILAIILIIAFDFYWLIRVLYMLIWLLISWQRYQREIKIPWFGRLKELKPSECPNNLKSKNWQDYYHLIILPTLGEPFKIIDDAFEAMGKAEYDPKKFIVVLTGEEIDANNYWPIARRIEEKYKNKFFKLLVIIHKLMPGDIQGKGSNEHWAGKRAKEFIDEMNIDYEKIIVSCFDIDTCVHPQYYAYLTYKFLTNTDPLHHSYQPVALYNNNIWESPFLMRVVYNSTTFWLLTDLARPERLFTFSSHSMPFQALVDVGFWQRDIVTEDSRIVLQCIARYDGNYSAEPLYMPLSMDTTYTGKFWQSLKSQYKQQRRWAYGVENFPYMMWFIWKNKKIKFIQKFRYLWNQLEGVYSWATAPIIIFLLGFLPLKFANDAVRATVLAQNAPIVLQWLMNAAMIGLIFSAILSTILLPPRPSESPRWKYIVMVIQWFIFPWCMVVFGSIPATDAQTRLMLGKYPGFNVTPKGRK